MNTSIELIKEILRLTKNTKIKSFQYQNVIYDFRNLEEPMFYLEDKIKISNKYIPLICEDFDLEFVLKNINITEKDICIITNENKFININVTIHANRRFLKRFIYAYLDEQNNFDFSISMKAIFHNHFNNLLDIYINNSLSDIKKDSIIINVIKELLKDSKPFNPLTQSIRHKDMWNFKMRLKEHKNTQMYLNHPFLFIVEDANIITVELYSPSLSMYHPNKLTAREKLFRSYLFKRLNLKEQIVDNS